MKWTLIYADLEGNSVQTFKVKADDPEQAARELDIEHEWLVPSFHLIAAVADASCVLVKDDARNNERALSR